jgi:GT2 family glycosyltransferase
MPSVSMIIPVYNAAGHLRKCLEHVRRSTSPLLECIVVDDGSTDDSAKVAQEFGATVLSTAGRSGPARARNIGARAAKGDILFFIDSDVCVYPDTAGKVAARFEEDPELDSVIGSYDSSPHDKDFLSQYRNLMHCYVHQTGSQEASTFWSGCGAIRRELFLEHSGFDESYTRPAIEDIELGYRLRRDKKKIVLDPQIQVKHLKSWSFFGLLKTDIMDRGIPWAELILRDRFLPNDLNIQLSQRVSVALAFLVALLTLVGTVLMGATLLLPLVAAFFLMLSRFQAGAPFNLRFKTTLGTIGLIAAIAVLAWQSGNLEILPPVLLAFAMVFLRHRYSYTFRHRRRATRVFTGIYLLFTILFVVTYLPTHPLVFFVFLALGILILLNSQFYLFLAAKQGRLFALAAIPFHLLFHFYNGISFLIALTHHLLGSRAPAAKTPAAAAPKQ